MCYGEPIYRSCAGRRGAAHLAARVALAVRIQNLISNASRSSCRSFSSANATRWRSVGVVDLSAESRERHRTNNCVDCNRVVYGPSLIVSIEKEESKGQPPDIRIEI